MCVSFYNTTVTTLLLHFQISETYTDTLNKEISWLQCIRENILDQPDDFKETNISWAAFHAEQVNNNVSYLPSINALLPLFHEHAASAPMIRHGMNLVKNATTKLNPGQIPVLCGDQPLFALGKQIQWNCSETFGEDKFVLLFGQFHIEQNFLRVLGQILQGSGWVGVSVSSGIIQKGSAEAILKVSFSYLRSE